MAGKRKRRKNKTQLTSTDCLDAGQVRFILAILAKRAEAGGYRAAVNLFIFLMLFMTGLRRCELAGLRMRDLPLYHRKFGIDVNWRLAKSSRDRFVVLDLKMVKIIVRFCRRFRPNAKSNEPLLVNEYGNAMTADSIYRRIRTIGRQTGITWLRPHVLRHTYCSLLEDGELVMDQAGHVSFNTTIIYRHLATKRVQKRLFPVSSLISALK